MNNTWLTIGTLSGALALGCSDTSEKIEEKEDIDQEGCEHLKGGPAVPITATPTTADAPTVNSDHKRYDATLLQTADGNSGYVSYAASEATDYVFFLGADIPTKFLDSSNAEVAPEKTATSSRACPEIKGRYLVPLEVGTYWLSLGPSPHTSVSIVVEESGHEH